MFHQCYYCVTYIKRVGRIYWQKVPLNGTVVLYKRKEEMHHIRPEESDSVSTLRLLSLQLQAVIFSFLTSGTLPFLTCNTGLIQLAIQPVTSVAHAQTDKCTHTYAQNTHTSVIRFRYTARFLYDKTEIENRVKPLFLIVHRSTRSTKKRCHRNNRSSVLKTV